MKALITNIGKTLEQTKPKDFTMFRHRLIIIGKLMTIREKRKKGLTKKQTVKFLDAGRDLSILWHGKPVEVVL